MHCNFLSQCKRCSGIPVVCLTYGIGAFSQTIKQVQPNHNSVNKDNLGHWKSNPYSLVRGVQFSREVPEFDTNACIWNHIDEFIDVPRQLFTPVKSRINVVTGTILRSIFTCA